MVGWHHRLNEHEFGQALGVGDGQGSLACCSPWGRKELDMTEWLHWAELRIVWFYLLTVQGSLKSLLQHHSLKASILWHSALFMVQFSSVWTIGEHKNNVKRRGDKAASYQLIKIYQVIIRLYKNTVLNRRKVQICKQIILGSYLIWLFQFSSVIQLFPTLCNLMDCSKPGFWLFNSWETKIKFLSVSKTPFGNFNVKNKCRPHSPSVMAHSLRSVLLFESE